MNSGFQETADSDSESSISTAPSKTRGSKVKDRVVASKGGLTTSQALCKNAKETKMSILTSLCKEQCLAKTCANGQNCLKRVTLGDIESLHSAFWGTGEAPLTKDRGEKIINYIRDSRKSGDSENELLSFQLPESKSMYRKDNDSFICEGVI